MTEPSNARNELVYLFGPFRLFPSRQLLMQGNRRVQVGTRACELLILLVQRSGEIVGRDELIAAAWPDVFVHDSNLKVNMSTLRRSLGDTQKQPAYIATVAGRGYRFVSAQHFYAAALDDLRGHAGAAVRMRSAIDELIETRFVRGIAGFINILADILVREGRLDEASDAIAEAMRYEAQQGVRLRRPELMRVEATILHRAGSSARAESTSGAPSTKRMPSTRYPTSSGSPPIWRLSTWRPGAPTKRPVSSCPSIADSVKASRPAT